MIPKQINEVEEKETFLQEFFSIFKILYWALTPIIVAILPVIPYCLTNDGEWMLLMIISMPVGSVLMKRMWTELTDPYGKAWKHNSDNILR